VLTGWAAKHPLRSEPGSCRRLPPCCRLWERKWELVSGETLAAGGALQVFGLVNDVVGRQSLGAQMGALVGAQSGRALSHGVSKRVSRSSRGGSAGRGPAPWGLLDPAPCDDYAV
jgi:hypothetical protein